MNVKARFTRGERYTPHEPWWLENYGPVMTMRDTANAMGFASHERVRQLEHSLAQRFLLAFTGCTFADVERQIELGMTDNGRSIALMWLDDLIVEVMGDA